MSRRLVLLLVLLCAACEPAPPKPVARPAVPMTRATVVTLRTAIEPGGRTAVHTIVISGDRARSTAERETWRLFDVKAKTVTFVDDVERTVRTEPLAVLTKRLRQTTSGELPRHFPDARVVRGEATKSLLGLTARQTILEAGAYRRELWLAAHPAIPRGLFAMMTVAETPSSPLAPMMRRAGEALSEIDGFPLADHSEVAYGNNRFVIDRIVTNVARRDVPAALITIPSGYRDLSKK